jgi:gamma-glutamylcyclotransferase (GGCT)/AIG2-like uncharacterized protein YtfP
MNPVAAESATRATPVLRLFVYGTLKRGGLYHERYCTGVRSIEAASVRGLIHRLRSGYPALVVPEAAILAHGSADAVADAGLQPTLRGEVAEPGGPWRDISGELLTFDDPQERLPPIDQLEDFHPGSASLYRRVLVPVRCQTGASHAAWAYVEGELARER